MDEIEEYLDNLKVQKNTYNGITEIRADDVLTWINSSRKKDTYVEPFIVQVNKFNWLETEKWLKHFRHFQILGHPVVVSCPTTITFIVMKKNVRLIRRRK